MATAKQYAEAHAFLREFAAIHNIGKKTRPFALHQRIHAWLQANPDPHPYVEGHINRLAEMSLAYERAAGVIESSCSTASEAEQDFIAGLWYDLDNVDEMVGDVTDEAEYLDSRSLLEHHPDNHRWVRICDEGEPLAISIPVLGVID
jgi:hypothetical protein